MDHTQSEPGSQSPSNANNDDLERKISQVPIPQSGVIDTGLAKRLCAELIAIRKQNIVLQQLLAEKDEMIEKMSSDAAPDGSQSFLATVKDNGGLRRQLAEMTERYQRLTAENNQLRNAGPPRVVGSQQAAQQELDYLRGRVRQLEDELRQLKAFLSSPSDRQFPGGHREKIPRPIQVTSSHKPYPAPQAPFQVRPLSREEVILQHPYLNRVDIPSPPKRAPLTVASDQQDTPAPQPGPPPQKRSPVRPQSRRSFSQSTLQLQQPINTPAPSQMVGAVPHVQMSPSPQQRGMPQLQQQALSRVMQRHEQHGSSSVQPDGRPILSQPLRIDTNWTVYPSASGQRGPVSASPTFRHHVPPPRSGTLVPAVWDTKGPNQTTHSPVRVFPPKRRHLTPITSNLAAQVIDLTLDDEEAEAEATMSHRAKRRRTESDIPPAKAPSSEAQIPAKLDLPSPVAAAPPTQLQGENPVSDDSSGTTSEEPQVVAEERISKESDEWGNNPVVMAFLEQAFSCDDDNPSQKRCYFCSERHVEDPEAWPAESITVFDSPTTQQIVEHIKDIHTVVWEAVVQMKDSDDEGETTVNDAVPVHGQ